MSSDRVERARGGKRLREGWKQLRLQGKKKDLKCVCGFHSFIVTLFSFFFFLFFQYGYDGKKRATRLTVLALALLRFYVPY